ncbi:hypothetical protein [Streptomyces sp. NPDC051662]|uniref:hypothetical protein n=1 Tax=Streptomyces sp. NPDC051662 TaxID=3154750 RepID=UPI00341BD8CF
MCHLTARPCGPGPGGLREDPGGGSLFQLGTRELTQRQLREEPHAGRLLVRRPGIAGVPAVPFDDLAPQETA